MPSTTEHKRREKFLRLKICGKILSYEGDKTVRHKSKLNSEIHPLNYFQRSKEHSAPINTTDHAGIKLSHDYQFRKFI